MRDFDSIKQKKMGIINIEDRVRHIYNKGYEDGYKDGDSNQSENSAYQYEQGLNDAWECAREICDIQNTQKVKDIFGADANYVLWSVSASEAIAKIKEWEEKKKQDNDEIKVGDEVYIIDKSYLYVVTADMCDRVVTMSNIGKYNVISKNILHKTGRHFPEIAEVLRKMQEGKG